jgi:hypothetical protein
MLAVGLCLMMHELLVMERLGEGIVAELVPAVSAEELAALASAFARSRSLDQEKNQNQSRAIASGPRDNVYITWTRCSN